MRTEEFLKSILGDVGHYCIVGLKPKEDRRVQKFYESLDDAITVASDLDSNGYDAYFALATFETGDSRKNDNVKQLRSLFLDLDCGVGKDYESQAEAVKALRDFCKKLNLPKPTLVNSGRGVHVYWALTEPVSRDEWLPIAERLKQLCRENGLNADPAVTADSARILRVPGTHNFKSDPPTKVELLGGAQPAVSIDDLKDLLGEAEILPPKKYVPREMDAMMTAISGSYVSKFKNILVKTQAGTGCAQLKHAITNQATISEPIWRAALSVAAFCEDRSKAIHVISKNHPEYDPEATEQKVAMIKGPYTCVKFDEYHPGVCAECPNWNKIKSPISLGREVIEASAEDNVVVEKLVDLPAAPPQQFVIPKYPAPYFRGKNGGVFKRFTREDDVVEVPVYHNDLYVLRRLRDPEIGECIVMRLHLPKDGVREFTLPLTSVGSKEEFRKSLSAHGVAVMKMDELMAYTHQWINDLQFKTTAEDARRQFGWTDDDKLDSFVIGNMEITKDEIKVNSPSSSTVDLFPMFKPKGTLEEWKETMEFWNRPGVEMHQYMVGLSFGSPLMAFFQTINGTVFHTFSKDSGLGKTTAMFAGASVWADPDRYVLQERDTYNSKMHRAEILKNLPLYVDEMTNTAPKDLSDFGYQIPSGSQRNRLSSKGNTERHRGEPWKLMCGSTGNTSILERIALYKAMPKAEAQRILERRATHVDFETKEETDNFTRKIMTCYGHAGVVYIQYLLKNKESINSFLLGVQKKIDALAELSKENRFWSVQASASIAGLMLAKRAGLINWNIEPIVQWIVNSMKSAKNTIVEMGGDVEGILGDYWAENYNSFLRIKSTDDARKNETGLDHLIQPEASPRMSLVARYEYDIKKLYLLIKPLKEWCGKHQINYSGFVDGLKAGRTRAKIDKVRLGKGTHINLPSKDVLVIDCSDFLDDDMEDKIATAAVSTEIQTSLY